MTRVGVARLKAQLSRYLDVAKHGEEVIITERGRPVAKLVALEASQRGESRRQQLARAGVLILGAQRHGTALRKPPRGPRALGDSVLQALLEERAEGR
jgi:prevent-host-death family protein